jgi:hypothetical protein
MTTKHRWQREGKNGMREGVWESWIGNTIVLLECLVFLECWVFLRGLCFFFCSCFTAQRGLWFSEGGGFEVSDAELRPDVRAACL